MNDGRYEICEAGTIFRSPASRYNQAVCSRCPNKLDFHDTVTDILARILAGTSDTRDFLKLFLWQAERHADILATILARMSARMSVSVSASWNVAQYGVVGG